MDQATKPRLVAIGVPPGSEEAFFNLIEALPVETAGVFIAFVDRSNSALAGIAETLESRTGRPAHPISSDEPLDTTAIRIVGPDRRLSVGEDRLQIETSVRMDGSIDRFFEELSQQRSDLLAVLLGDGDQGSSGIEAVKEVGGIVLAELPSHKRHRFPAPGPTTAPDIRLPLSDLARQIALMAADPDLGAPETLDQTDENYVDCIFAQVKTRTGHDFSQYKRPRMLRRIARRAHLTHRRTLGDYFEFLKDRPEEVEALFKDFLISVTGFFRDPEAFTALSRQVMPRLFDGKETGSLLRLWVPGCATGEEAYSLAMLLLEEADRQKIQPQIQIFASDINVEALSFAREGRFPETIAADIDADRLKRFFTRSGEHYRVRREVRDMILFARHNLLGDPPFSRLDLVSCRNLLIYLDRGMRQQVFGTFHYALKPGGYLFLGTSEMADQPNGLFHRYDAREQIYQAVPRPGRKTALAAPLFAWKSETPPPAAILGNSARQTIHRQMLERSAPPAILVDDAHRAVHLTETAGRFLQPSAGPLSTDAVDLVREELRFDLRLALHRAFERRETSLSIPVLMTLEGAPRRVYLQVQPVDDGDDQPPRFAAVSFIEGEPADRATNGAAADEESRSFDDIVRQLQEELQLTRTGLRRTREEAEGIHGALRAANEELQSINEEYRSTAEELETSKEELQSLNKELQTVNNELKLELDVVSRAHSDLQNLIAEIDFAMLFLDSDLKIKRFTPHLTDIFNVTAADEGRSIADFTHELHYDEMAEEVHEVLTGQIPVEREVRGRNGEWYLVRIRPYKTIEDKIDGVVVSFIDVTERRRVDEALRESEARLRQEMRLVELSRAPIFVWDLDDGIVQWNRGSEQLYGYSREEVLGKRKELLLKTKVPGSSFAMLRQSLIDQGSWAGEISHCTKDGRRLLVDAQIEMITMGERRMVLESTRDVTDRRLWEARQKLLLGELTHRVKNTLTVVQSMARQTLRNTKSSAEFVERFEGRLFALANAHKLLVDSHWRGAELGALIESQLQAYIIGDSRRIRTEGEPILLPADLATPFGLVLHELATNAAKYGSLSVAGGEVALSWRLIPGNSHPNLEVVWRELNGPAVRTPKKIGFGRGLIEKGVPGARVRYEFPPNGVFCIIDLPYEQTNTDEADPTDDNDILEELGIAPDLSGEG